MKFKDVLATATDSLAAWIAAAVAAGFVWLVRRIFTNQKQIELMQKDLSARDEMRLRDREDILEVKRDVKDLRKDIQEAFRREK